MQKIPLLMKVVFLHFSLLLITSSMLQSGSVQPASASLLVTNNQASSYARPLTLRGEPVQIKIPRLEIDLPIVDGVYDEQTQDWNVSESDVQFARITSLPSTGAGNTFIYGHNTDEVLGRTTAIEPGDELLIETANNRVFRYVYVSDTVTTPNDTSVLSSDYEKPTLTLLTCSGFWSQNRRLMHFDFVGVQ